MSAPRAMSISAIPIFTYIPKDVIQKLGTLSTVRNLVAQETLLEVGVVVPALFIVFSGSVGVYTQGFEQRIAILNVGDSIGEMSFIDENKNSSACVRAEGEGATIICIARADFEREVLIDPAIANHFYKASAKLLAKRLRSTNQAVKETLGSAITMLKEILNDYGIVSNMENVRNEIDESGVKLVKTLINAVNGIDDLIAKTSPMLTQDLDKIRAPLLRLLQFDLQSSDRLYQKMDLVLQVLENIQRVLRGEEVREVKGDVALLNDKP